ncbi:MAG: Group 1 glycosyl transferase [Candidatus Saccharibacteria bacterium]|nr:Group 1 glycosyl transferase [Candidatus Saccharibacteria bacterium]
MRIAVVADPFVSIPPKKYGGIEQVIYNSIKGLLELGHEPILLAAGDSDVPCELIPVTPQAVSFASSRADMAAHNRKVIKIAKNTEAILQKLIKHKRIDLIHSHVSATNSPFDIRRFKHFPNVTTLHNPIRFDEIEYYKRRYDINYISISKNQQEAFPELNYVGVVYNGENPAEFPVIEKPDDYVCFLGRFDRQKNPHLAIMLAISLGIPIKVAGKVDHASEGYFVEEVEPYFSHPLVEYLGELDFEEKIDVLSRARVNLHPTGFREPFGLTVLEAAYCGTPTLAIAKGALPELIEDGRTGLLTEDFIEGYTKLRECLEMDRSYIAKRARALFNYKTMAEQYVKAYEVALERYAISREREKIFQGLTKRAKEELEEIWQRRPQRLTANDTSESEPIFGS